MPISIPVDFSGVEARTTVRVPEGDYTAKLVKIQKTNAKTGDKNPMLVVDFEFTSGGKGVQGQRIRDRHILIKDSLWTLRNMLEAMGLKVPNGKMNIKEGQLVGRTVGLTVIDGDEYKGKIKSEVGDYIPADAVGNIVQEDSSDDEEEWDDEDEPEETLTEVEDDETEEEEDDEEEADSFDFDDEEDEEEEDEPEEEEVEVELSFSQEEVSNAKGVELKTYLKEAMEAGFEFELSDKPKVAEVRDALLALFDDDDEMEGFDLDDV